MTDLEKALQTIEDALKVVRAEDKCAAQDIQEVVDAMRDDATDINKWGGTR